MRSAVSILRVISLVILWGSTPQVLLADASVYEGFDSYANIGALTSDPNGGQGFASRWQGRGALLGTGSNIAAGSLELLPSSLDYTDADGNMLDTSGDALHLSGEPGNSQTARSVDNSALPNNAPDPQVGQTTYLSFLARRSGPPANPEDPIYEGSYPWGDNLYPRVAGFNLFTNDPGGDPVTLLVGNASNTTDDVWRLRGQDLDGSSKDPKIDAPFGEGNMTYLVVMRIDHGDGDNMADEVNLYLNPRLANESLNTIGVTADWEQRDDPMYLPGLAIGLEVGNASGNRPHSELTFDEFRIGQTWQDVLPFSPATPTLPGDYNGDEVVDAADYAVWRNNLGAAAGTLDNDIDGGVIGTAQHNTWRFNYGEKWLVAVSEVAVPAPAAMLNLAVLVSTLLLRRQTNLHRLA